MSKVGPIVTHATLTFAAITLALGVYLKLHGDITWVQFAPIASLTLGVMVFFGLAIWFSYRRKKK